MSEACEVCESLATATSSVPVADVIVVVVSSGTGASTAVVGPQPYTVITSTAVAQSAADASGYATASSNAEAIDHADVSGVSTYSGVSVSASISSAGLELSILSVSTGNASALSHYDAAMQEVVERAVATATVTASKTADILTTSRGVATSQVVSKGLEEFATSVAVAIATTIQAQRIASIGTESSAYASGSVLAAESEVAEALYISGALATANVALMTDSNVFVTSDASASADVKFRTPDARAWVMNTETTAVSIYDNFAFESIATVGGRHFAVGVDGIYELVGDTDSGDAIDAEVTSGFTDFGSSQTKRIDAMYFGYTSSGQLSVTAETYESGHAPATYLLEQRDADAPRNSRVRVGKGLFGRYWRLSIRNVEGVDFDVHDATVDIATSSRRV